MARGRRAVTVLGDVVGSRLQPTDLPNRLRDGLQLANARVGSVQPLTPTIGDEFQGLYPDLVSALDATLTLRVALLGTVDVRFGIGSGELFSFDPADAPFRQDGPAWWAARDAIGSVREAAQRQERPRGMRTRWVDAGGRPPFVVAAVNAFLQCRDELIAAMDPRDAAAMLGLLADEPLASIAAEQGISVSAISQRAIRNGLYAIRQAHRELHEAAG